MADEASPVGEQDAAPPDAGPGRWVRRLLWLLVFLEVIWLVAGNAFLRTSWGASLLGRRPEKLQITWESGWTPLPGLVRVQNVDVRGRTPKVTWMGSLDAAWLWIAPLDLLRRRFHVRWLAAEGLETRVRMDRKDPQNQPTIEGFEGLPEPARRAVRRPWRLDFDRVSIRQVRELWFGPLRYLANENAGGAIKGRLRCRVRGPLAVPWADVELGPGRASGGSEILGEVTRLAFAGRLDSFVPKEVRGVAILGRVSGTFEAATSGGGLGLVDYFFRGAPASVHGTGRLDTRLHLDRGVLQTASHLSVDDGSVSVSYLGWRGEGNGRLQGEVGNHGETTLEVALDEVDLGLNRVTESLVVSRDARLVATTDRFDLAVRRPQLQVMADLPESEIADLAKLQDFLPAHAGVELVGGSGLLSARGQLATTDPKPDATAAAGLHGTVSGSVKIHGNGVDVRVQGREIVADVELEARVPDGDLATRRLTIDGSRLQLHNVRMKSAGTADGSGKEPPSWWADLKVPRGSVQMPKEGSVVRSAVDAELAADLADSRPLLALLVEKRASLRWFERLLTFEDLDLEGIFRTRDDGVELRDVRIHDRAGEKADKDLQILGQLRFDEQGHQALLRASMRIARKNVAAGVRVRDGKVDDIDLRHSLEWYREQTDLFWRESEPESPSDSGLGHDP
ncbi:MAG: hypothetical protein MPN21_24340 [Thermoanaerobaculia bacterium]|nr:hypothetical protein [Thermoanaerobaculia bacterium]